MQAEKDCLQVHQKFAKEMELCKYQPAPERALDPDIAYQVTFAPDLLHSYAIPRKGTT